MFSQISASIKYGIPAVKNRWTQHPVAGMFAMFAKALWPLVGLAGA
jgi:hypothetical protein